MQKGYVFAAALGAVAGGAAVAVSTRAVPNIISAMQEHCREMCMGRTERNDTESAETISEKVEPKAACCGES
jgi:hypothetical protein